MFPAVSDHKAAFQAQVGHVIVGGIFVAGGLVMHDLAKLAWKVQLRTSES